MKRRNAVLAVVLLVVAVGYFVFDQSGYSLSQERALRRTDSYSGLAQVSEQSLGGDKIVMRTNGSLSKTQIVHRKWGFLYKPGTSVEMAALPGNANVRYAWFSADSGRSDGKVDVVFAAESDDPKVKTIIVSNDTLSAPKDSAEAKANATVYVELDVARKYAIVVQALDQKDIGSFVVRGADAEGRFVTAAK